MTSTSAAPDQPPEGIGLVAFNALPAERARGLLLGCCHAGRWAAKVTAGRPYPALDALLARARTCSIVRWGSRGGPVRLERMTGGGTPLAEAVTGENGRVAELGLAWSAGLT